MAVTITNDLTNLWIGNETTGWTGTSPDTVSDGTSREGSEHLTLSVNNTTVSGYRSYTSFDLTGKAIYIWVRYAGRPDTLANGGFGIVVGDGTNRRAYYVGGNDIEAFTTGGWICHVFDPANPPTGYNQEAGSAAPSFTAVTQVGYRFKMITKAIGGLINVNMDVGRYGSSLFIKGGTSGAPGKFSEIAADDASTSSGKAYGIIREIQPGVYGIQGKLIFGDASGTTSTYFEDTSAIVLFESTSGAGDTLYEMNVVGNSTGTNSFILGEKIGTGDSAIGSAGVLVYSTGPLLSVDVSDSNINTLGFFGSTLNTKGGDILLPPYSASREVISATFSECGQVVGHGCYINRSTFLQSVSDGALQIAASADWNVKNCNFINNSDGIEHTATGSFTYDNLQFNNNTYDINNTSGGAVTINPTNGSNPVTYTGSTTITISPVTTTITVQDVTTLTAIENARVLLIAASGGPLNYQDSVTITRSGSTATVTHTGHGLANNDLVLIEGADQTEYNGVREITVTSVDEYTYVVSGTPTTPATGTITSTTVIFNNLTNASGIVSESRSLSSDQPVAGRARRSSSSPLYRNQPITGTISSSTGLSLTVLIIPDE